MRRSPLIAVFLFIAVMSVAIFFGSENLFSAADGRCVIKESALINEKLLDSSGREFSIADFKGHIVVADFWFTGCSICFKKFTYFQKLSDEMRGRSVVLATVNVPQQQEESSRLRNLELVRNYHFPKWAIKEGNIDTSKWSIEGYPKVFVFDKMGRLRYKGGFFYERKYLVNNIHDIIAKLEKE